MKRTFIVVGEGDRGLLEGLEQDLIELTSLYGSDVYIDDIIEEKQEG